VILTGSPVPAPHESPTVGAGLPVRGETRLLGVSTPDPAGGLPWGMRIFRTTRGLICVQIGRLDHGRLGELGVDGAFGNDGRFHPFPAAAFPATRFATGTTTCQPPMLPFAGDIVGLEASAASNPRPDVGVAADRREVSVGLLGPHAVSVTYRDGSATHTQPVIPGLGAYLIVQRVTSGRTLGSISSTLGWDGPRGFPTSPNGALTAITYRYGTHVCTDTGRGPIAQACGLSVGPPLRAAPLPATRVPVSVRLQVRGDVVTGARVSFRAPYAVTSANESYAVDMPVCTGPGGTATNEDLARGQLVTVSLSGDLLGNTCRRPLPIQITYLRFGTGIPAITPIGAATVRPPPGTHFPRLPGCPPPKPGLAGSHACRIVPMPPAIAAAR
jgi:hypothetical protein